MNKIFTAEGIVAINQAQIVKAEPLDNGKDIAFYFNTNPYLCISFRFNNEVEYQNALNVFCKGERK